MNKIDLIIENFEYAKLVTEQAHKDELLEEALAAARSLRELNPVGYTYTETDHRTQYKHLVGAINDQTLAVGTPLYALDEVTK